MGGEGEETSELIYMTVSHVTENKTLIGRNKRARTIEDRKQDTEDKPI